jgi:hypothetical protein
MLEVPEGNILVLALAPWACLCEFKLPVLFIKLNMLVPVGNFRVVVGILGSGVLDDLSSHLGHNSWSRHKHYICFPVGTSEVSKRCERTVILKQFELTSELHVLLEQAHIGQVLDGEEMAFRGLLEYFLIDGVSV